MKVTKKPEEKKPVVPAPKPAPAPAAPPPAAKPPAAKPEPVRDPNRVEVVGWFEWDATHVHSPHGGNWRIESVKAAKPVECDPPEGSIVTGHAVIALKCKDAPDHVKVTFVKVP